MARWPREASKLSTIPLLRNHRLREVVIDLEEAEEVKEEEEEEREEAEAEEVVEAEETDQELPTSRTLKAMSLWRRPDHRESLAKRIQTPSTVASKEDKLEKALAEDTDQERERKELARATGERDQTALSRGRERPRLPTLPSPELRRPRRRSQSSQKLPRSRLLKKSSASRLTTTSRTRPRWAERRRELLKESRE